MPVVELIALLDIGLKAINTIANLQGGQLSQEYVDDQNKLMNAKADAIAARAAALARQTEEAE